MKERCQEYFWESRNMIILKFAVSGQAEVWRSETWPQAGNGAGMAVMDPKTVQDLTVGADASAAEAR